MHELKLIELTGLANAAYRHDVVLPTCERRAAQTQVLAETPTAQTRWWQTVWSRRWHAWRRSAPSTVGRTTTTALPDA
jgi:hypothetical protein